MTGVSRGRRFPSPAPDIRWRTTYFRTISNTLSLTPLTPRSRLAMASTSARLCTLQRSAHTVPIPKNVWIAFNMLGRFWQMKMEAWPRLLIFTHPSAAIQPPISSSVIRSCSTSSSTCFNLEHSRCTLSRSSCIANLSGTGTDRRSVRGNCIAACNWPRFETRYGSRRARCPIASAPQRDSVNTSWRFNDLASRLPLNRVPPSTSWTNRIFANPFLACTYVTRTPLADI